MAAVTMEGRTRDSALDAGKMRFLARYSNAQPYYGPSLSLDVTDSQGRPISHTLFQGGQPPTDEAAKNTGGFTGLQYINDPDTGAEVQYSCNAE